MVQFHLFISGRVQGVGFRNFVKMHARRLGLFGWTQNLADGRVEAVLQGDPQKIEQVVTACRKGPMLSEVQHVEVIEEEGEEVFDSFIILKRN